MQNANLVRLDSGKFVNLGLIAWANFTAAKIEEVPNPIPANPLEQPLRQVLKTTTDATLYVQFATGEYKFRGADAEQLNERLTALVRA